MGNYNYKQLTSISIKDFRNLGDVNIDFTKSPIVCLKGGNEAGKSSVVIALKTLGSNLSSRQYKEYIRTGTDAWVIMLYTEDGAAVYRKKTATKQVYGIYKFIDGKYELVWSIDKLDENAVPSEVQSIIGFTTEPETRELLNVRTYEDQMLFVETSGGSNYKVMYNALKIDNLTKAIKAGNGETKLYRQEVEQAENSVVTCKEQLRKIRTIDVSALLKIRDRLKKESHVVKLLEKAISSQRLIRSAELELKAIMEIDKLPKIDEYLYSKLDSAYHTYENIKTVEYRQESLEKLRKLSPIEITVLEKLEKCCSLKSSLDKLNVNIYSDIDKCKLVELNSYEKMQQAISLMESYNKNYKLLSIYNKNKVNDINENIYLLFDKLQQTMCDLNTANQQYIQMKSVIDNFYNQLRLQNIPFGVCPNCGELILAGE